jgi:hypothetical protein
MHLLVFRGGLCVRDLGLVEEDKKDPHGTDGAAIVEQAGIVEHGYVADDGRAAIYARTLRQPVDMTLDRPRR